MNIFEPGGGAGMKKRFIAVATAVAISGAAVFAPAVVMGQTDTSALIAQLQAQIAALQAQLNALLGSQGSGSTGGVQCTFTRDLFKGVSGDDVLCLQRYLNSAGFTLASSGAGSPGNETNYFGSITHAAVVRWQNANAAQVLAPVGLSAGTGYWGSSSRSYYSMIVASAPPAPPAPPVTPPAQPSVTPIGTGLTVTAHPAQPPADLSPIGATRVPYTKVQLTASADGDITVKSMTIERMGLADDDAFDSVVLTEEDGTQIGLSKTLNSDHQATIHEDIVVKAGTTKTIVLAGNMLSSAPSTSNAGQIAKLALVAVDAGSSAVNGTLPIVGNGMTINESLTIGTVTMQRGSLDPGSSQTKEIGTTGYIFSSVKVTAGSAEKVYLKSMRWNQTGSAGVDDMANLVTVVDGTEYPVTISSDGKYFTSSFDDNGGKGILIDKGFSKDISIRGDIVGGSSRTIDFDIAKRIDVGVVGELYGYGITPPQTGSSVPTADSAAFSSSEDPWYDAAQVTASNGTMTVSKSNAVPSQNVAINLPNTPLGAFTVDVKGEPISVSSMYFNVTLGSEGANDDVNDLTNITLVDENGSVVAGPVDGSATDSSSTTGSGDGSITFSTTVTFPVGIHDYKLLGKIGTDIDNNVTIIASTTPTDWSTVRGTLTGNSITPSPSSAVTSNTMTVKSGSLAISVSSVPIAQTVIAGAKGFEFARYILDATASGEDVRMVSIPLEYNTPSGGSASSLSNCQLYDGSTSITTGSNVVNPTAIASATTFTFDGSGLILPKGTTKSLSLKCDLAGGATGGYQWGVSNQASSYTGASGLTSGQTIAETFTASAGQKMTSSTGGTLSVALDSSSPGYQVFYAGQTGVELARYKFSATNEDINLKQVALQLSRTASNTPINLVGQKVTLWTEDGVLLGDAVFSGANEDYATSSTIASGAFLVPRDGSKTLVVKGDIAAITASGPMTRSGDYITVDYDGGNVGLNGTYGSGAASGNTINGGTSDTSSSGGRIFKAYPKFEHVPLTSTERTLSPGTTADKTLYKFKVTAVGDDVALYKFTFAVSSSTAPTNAAGATTSLFSLYSYLDSAYSSPDTSFSSDGLLNSGQCFNGRSSTAAGAVNGTGNPLEIYMDRGTAGGASADCNNATTTYEIPAGVTRYFRLAATVASVEGVTGTESFTVQMEGDAAFPTGIMSVGSTGSGDMGKAGAITTGGSGSLINYVGIDDATHNDFIWSPISTTTDVSINDFDYTNGYLMPGLPTTNMTIETFTSPN